MKVRFTMVFLWAMGAMALTPAHAQYLTDSRGEVVRNAYDECWHTGFWTSADAIVGCDGKVAEAPAPEVTKPVPPSPPVPLDPVVLNADTHFAFDSARLLPGARAVLDALVEEVQGYESVESVTITGHADRIGDATYNQRLSERRAQTVRQYLIDNRALRPQLIQVSGKGETRPVVVCEGLRGQPLVECLAPNRRVEVVIQCVGCVEP
ncbi:MAG: OmpA family protein [Gammaproteobacteria bacterium]|nr:OmpA family protein [Gammaproteobacteria bacterium]